MYIKVYTRDSLAQLELDANSKTSKIKVKRFPLVWPNMEKYIIGYLTLLLGGEEDNKSSEACQVTADYVESLSKLVSLVWNYWIIIITIRARLEPENLEEMVIKGSTTSRYSSDEDSICKTLLQFLNFLKNLQCYL